MSVPADLHLLLSMTRRKMKPAQRVRSRRKMGKRWLYPYQAEREYIKALEGLTLPLLAQLIELIKSAFPTLLREAGVKADALRADDWVDTLTEMILAANVDLKALFGEAGDAREGLWLLITNSGMDTYLFNRKQWGKTTSAMLGFEYQTPEAWWPTMSKAWAQENYNLISSASSSQITSINELAMRAVRTGMTPAQLAAELDKLNLKYRKRIELIAVDQIGKLNGALTKARQTEAGLDFYTWDTANDERVRGRPGGKYPNAIPSHWAMQGMMCRWDNNNVYADPATDIVRDERGDIVSINWQTRRMDMPFAIPGEEIRCRCTATPVWESFLMNADQEIE